MSEASEATTWPQFHVFGTTFGASDAPGPGDAFGDGFRADFENDSSRKKTQFSC